MPDEFDYGFESFKSIYDDYDNFKEMYDKDFIYLIDETSQLCMMPILSVEDFNNCANFKFNGIHNEVIVLEKNS